MTLVSGFSIPAFTLHIKTSEGIEAVESTDYFADKKTVIFTVPGAFTPTCSARHLPGYIELATEIKAQGVDAIGCIAVNDAHAMQAWGDAAGAAGKIDMIADARAGFADLLGIAVDMGPVMGYRAARCAFIAENGVVTQAFLEEPGAFDVSSAEHVLNHLKNS